MLRTAISRMNRPAWPEKGWGVRNKVGAFICPLRARCPKSLKALPEWRALRRKSSKCVQCGEPLFSFKQLPILLYESCTDAKFNIATMCLFGLCCFQEGPGFEIP
jgi:hypothetical protein